MHELAHATYASHTTPRILAVGKYSHSGTMQVPEHFQHANFFKMAGISGGPFSKFELQDCYFSDKIIVFDSTTLIYANVFFISGCHVTK